MIYWLLEPWMDLGPANALRYISVRTGIAMATALFLFLGLYPSFMRMLQRRGGRQVIRDDVPDRHQTKTGTPTMGGLLICFAVLVTSILWLRPYAVQAWYVLVLMTCFCGIGFADDYAKIRDKKGGGISGRMRLALEFGISGLLIGLAVYTGALSTELWLPVFKEPIVDLGWAYVPFGMAVIVGCANAVNLTDGLDGLAIGPVMVAAMTYGLMAWLTGNAIYSEFLSLPHVPGNGELTVVAIAVVGAGIGFLWFNTFPASLFMGDTGSLPLGGALGGLAVFTKNELLLVVVGGVFVAEALSVIIQVASFKTTGKRVFRMAPIHHHFEQKGWEEPKIIVRFWIISILLALLALMTLKVR